MSIEKLNSDGISTLINSNIGFTVIPTFVIQKIPTLEASGLWVYLLSLPSDWKIIRSHLAKHFGIGKDKLKKAFDTLIGLGLLEEYEERDEKGRFKGVITKVNLGLNVHSPEADLPHTVKSACGKSATTNTTLNTNAKSFKNTCVIDEIFDYWKAKSNHPKSKLDQKRKSAIEKALKNYSVDEIKDAIDGCLASEYNVQNGFDDIELICRNASKTERFIKLSKNTGLCKKKTKHSGFMAAVSDAWEDLK